LLVQTETEPDFVGGHRPENPHRARGLGAGTGKGGAVLAAGGWGTPIFWKYCSAFDSTDDGNIGPVAEALMESNGTGQTICGPAFPENGRAIFMGNLFVGREPLAESPMKDHPLTPMRDSNLMRLLAPQVTPPRWSGQPSDRGARAGCPSARLCPAAG